MKPKPLSIGIIIDHEMIPLWSYDIIESIQNSKFADIDLIIFMKDSSEVSNKGSLLFSLYMKFDRKRFPSEFESSKQVALNDTPKSVEKISYESLFKREYSDTRKKKDVILDLTFNQDNQNIAAHGTYGVWQIVHSVHQNEYSFPPGIWEVFNDLDSTGAVLKVNYELRSLTLDRMYLNRDEVSVNRNLDDLLWASKDLILKNLKRLNEKGISYINNASTFDLVLSKNTYPSNIDTIVSGFKLLKKGFNRKKERKNHFEQWILLYQFGILEDKSFDFDQFTKILPPKDRFWADPFVYHKNGRYHLFFEELVYEENKGRIMTMTLDSQGNHSQPKVILEKDYHLSYPFLIEEQGELYMIPETMDNETIEMYKCVDFPYKWVLQEVIMSNIRTTDTTIMKHNGKFWLFTNVEFINEVRTTNELFIFYSEELLNGDWKPHSNNPISSDHHISRPAGTIFKINDQIIRPSQNCSKRYGYGINFQSIMNINEDSYLENNMKSTLPNWASEVIGTHTFNHSNGLTIIDAIIKRKR